MRKMTLILGCVFILMLTCAGLFLLGGTLSAQLTQATASAADYPDAFAAIRQAVASGGAPQLFDAALPDDPAACRLEDVTITLSNRGLIDAEWISVFVDGAPGDIAVYAVTGEGGTIPGRSTASVNLKVVSLANSTGRRAYRVQYYVYGMKRTVTVAQSY